MSRRRPEDDEPRENVQPGRPKPRRVPPPDEEGVVERPRTRRPPREVEDEDDDRPRRRPAQDEEDDGYSGVVPYRNLFALVGYYMGFLGLIAILGGFAFLTFRYRQDPIGVSPGLVGFIVFGVIYGLGGISALMGIIFGGIGLAKASKEKGTAHAIVGVVLGALEIVGLLAIMFLGLLSRGR